MSSPTSSTRPAVFGDAATDGGTVGSGDSIEVIRGAATREFVENGFHGTTMRTIAANADMSTAGIYHHYKSKEDILFDVLCAGLRVMVAASEAALRTTTDPVERLRALVRAHVAYHLDHQPEAFIGSSELRSLTGDRRTYAHRLRRHQQGIFDDAVAAIQQAGYEIAYPDETSRAIVAMGNSVASWYRAGGRLSREAVIERYATLATILVGAYGR